VKTLPLTPNGKVDRRALPAPEDNTLPVAARRTPEETVLAGIWAKVLGRPHIGIHDDFFALGGHSLLAAQAIALIRTNFTTHDIPLHMLYEAPTIATFARALGRGTLPPANVEPADLHREVALDPAITPPTITRRPLGAQPTGIFLTGATGFLGAFLLNQLLTQTSANIYCLVRDTDTQAAGRRIQQTLAGYHLWHDSWHSRIIPVLGDLREPLFGLNVQTFRDLASATDVIYHAGGQVHYLYPYPALKAANVQGTIEIIRLACQERLKPIHYISSILTAASNAGAHVYEDDDLGDCHDPTGYGQSKWVAEGILRLARKRGVPVAIYRPGRIGSHSRTGAANSNDFFIHLLAGCLQLGLAPDVPMEENLIPVDYTAQAIVHLSKQTGSANKTFHMLNPESISWPRVVGGTQALGYPLQMASYQIWYSALVDAAAADPSHPLNTLLPFLPQGQMATRWIERLERQAAAGKWFMSMSTAAASYHQMADQDFDTKNTIAGLANSNIRCPVITTPLLKCLLADGARRGLFAVPASVSETIAESSSILCLQ